MEQFRMQGSSKCPDLFSSYGEEEGLGKIGTEVFDSTLPSELQFDEEQSTTIVQKTQGPFSLFDEKIDEPTKDDKILPSQEKAEAKKVETASSQYDLLTKSIVTFSFKANKNILFGQSEYAVGSFIPHFLGVSTYEIKFKDDQSELSKGSSAFQRLWKNVIGYVKTLICVNGGWIYLLEHRKQGLLVKTSWCLSNIFKIFSDKQQKKARIIFRSSDHGEMKLTTKEIQEVDLNFLASLLAQASSAFEISSLD